tara:strand:+ start:66 stop:1523 length:1458 start_codon:yes stop_codon:yes gene_type:complete
MSDTRREKRKVERTMKKQQKLWDHDLVPQVVETNLNENLPPERCVGFIYCWTNLDSGRWYRGKHQGYPRDGYLFSSKQEDFLLDFTDPNSRWRYEILNYVTTNTTDLTNLEYKILTELDARNDPMSYNKSNGIPVKTNEPDLEKVQNLANQIKNQEFPIRSKVKISDLMKKIIDGDRIQSRFKDRSDLIKDITGFINDAGGITDPCPVDCVKKNEDGVIHEHIVGCDPVVMLHDVTYRGKFYSDIITDGNQTTQGAYKADKAVTLRVQDVPAEETEDFTDAEFILLGNLLNPPQKKKKDPTNRADFEHFMENEFYNSGQIVATTSNRVIGKDVHMLSSGTVRRAIEAVEDRIEQAEIGKKTGEVFCDYETPAYEDKLRSSVEHHNSLNGVYCYETKTGWYKLATTVIALTYMMKQNEINEELNKTLKEEDQKEIFHELRILCWHKLLKHQDNWKKEKLVHENQFEYVLSKCGITCTLVEMPTWQD